MTPPRRGKAPNGPTILKFGNEPTGQKLSIELTREEYRRLIEVVYLGTWVANAFRTDDVLEEYEEIEQVLYPRAKDFGADDAVVYSEELEEWFPTREFEEEIHPLIDEYDNEMLFDELAHRLANRDLEREVGEKRFRKLGVEEFFRKQQPYLDRYELEFEAHGIEHLEIGGE